MIRRCPACRSLVGPAVLLTATLDRKCACRRCWATIQATRKSALYAGAAGVVLGILLFVPLYLWAHKLNRGYRIVQFVAIPSLLAGLFSRLFPRFEVVDSPLNEGGSQDSDLATRRRAAGEQADEADDPAAGTSV